MSKAQETALLKFSKEHIRQQKGALSFALVITRRFKEYLDQGNAKINPNHFRTAKEGQVAGLGGGAINKILKEHGVNRTLSAEGGRTSRGTMGKLRAYAKVLNKLQADGNLDLAAAEKFWVKRIEEFFQGRPFKFRLDASKSLRFSIAHLLKQANERQRQSSGTMYTGTVMQHLVGAKLDLIMKGKLDHHGASVADAPTSRTGDFVIGGVAIHVTTAPTSTLLTKASENLGAGLRPLIVTTEAGLGGAKALAMEAGLDDRVDVIEIEQFLATNIYEWSRFDHAARPTSIRDLVARYNKIVDACESDPSLKIEFEG